MTVTGLFGNGVLCPNPLTHKEDDMPKEEWGTKRLCPKTGKRFYDLNKDPIISPYTGEVVEPETDSKNRTMVADKADQKSVAADQTDDVVLDDDDAADIELDDDLLDDDDDDNVSLDDIADVSDEGDDS